MTSPCEYKNTTEPEKYQFEYHFENNGKAKNIDHAPKNSKFSSSLWGIKRQTRCDRHSEPRQEKSLLDAPFYSRATVSTSIKGAKTIGVFEALDLRRFRNPLLMFMLAVRKIYIPCIRPQKQDCQKTI